MDGSFQEINFDGLVGPTHNYSGLSSGNIASIKYRSIASNPKAAALEGLSKMKTLMDLGLLQAVVAPQERPHIPTLRSLGFFGTDAKIIEQAAHNAPDLLRALSSASPMWTANAWTMSPSSDSSDRRAHFSPANLVAKFHRSIEAPFVQKYLEKVFADKNLFEIHSALPSHSSLGDEGAANHTRFCPSKSERGLHFFVFGQASDPKAKGPKKFPARQTELACQAIARRHLLGQDQVVLAQQNPIAIDSGAFHNDVVAVGNQRFFFFHESAFTQQKKVLKELQTKAYKLWKTDLKLLEVRNKDLSLKDAIRSYVFNSQIVTLPDGSSILIAPSECQATPSVKRYLKKILENAAYFSRIEFLDLRQSMQNGGGPACLRNRVILNSEQIQSLKGRVLLTPELYARLVAWVESHYRDQLRPKDLADPKLLTENRTALDSLSKILELGSIYPFQN